MVIKSYRCVFGKKSFYDVFLKNVFLKDVFLNEGNDDMNDEQIKIFLSVAQAGSFSKAEESMHISKQAMLKQINALEDELDVKLLFRSHRGIILTPSGQIFQKGVIKINRQLEKLIDACRDASGAREKLLVGNVEHQALLTRVTQVFMTRYPDVLVRQVIHPNHSGEWRVCQGIQDVAETFRKVYEDNSWLRDECTYRRLTTVPYVAAMREGHPLSKRKTVTLKALAGYETLIFSVMLEEIYRDQIFRAFQTAPDHLISREDVDNQVQVAYECIETDRILITANPFIEGIAQLVKVPLDTGWTREYGVVFREPATEAVRKYVGIAEELYSEARSDI